MSGMFTKAARFNQPLNSWRTGCVRDMSGMFRGASSFDQPLDKWDVSRVETAEKMFNDASCFSRPLDMWQIPRACNVNDMFLNAPRFTDVRTLALNFFLTNKKKYREYLKEVLGRFDAAQVYAELSRYDCSTRRNICASWKRPIPSCGARSPPAREPRSAGRAASASSSSCLIWTPKRRSAASTPR